ncbi:MAG TPA: class I adenylate-forming enzyme family protein [Stellaceae bacterium]|jgi:acyl-CoA synthetase|nr:class I adenylate-forming enzyme family protein [Stellaceae bacterium]
MTNTLLTLHDPAAALRYYADGAWCTATLYTLLQAHAAARPDDFALRDGTRRLTWAALLKLVEAVAADLDAHGLKRGERVAVWLPNRVEAVAVFLACSRNGYVCNPSLHQNYTVAEIVELLTRTRAAALFAQPGYGADARAANIFAVAAAEVPSLRRIYTLGEGAANAAPFPDADSARPLPPVDANPDKIVYLAFTSGTTGTPKGVMHSDNTLLANGRAMVEDWHHDHSSILLSLSPMSHHIGTVALEQMMAAGLELVVNAPPPGKTPLDWVIETGATYVMGVPTHAMDILEQMRARRLDRLGNVKTFYMAGSPIPREVAQAFLDRGVTPQNVYGMTENGSHQYTLPSDPAETIVATCGRACRAYEIRIWDQENPDIEAAPGTVGEIGGRGACLTLGYFDNQQATEDSFNRDGWFMSGDLGRIDENGCLEIAGRKKDLIIRGGHNIHPAKIEDLAMRHPAVARCAAFGVGDRRLGEKVCLSVIFHNGTGAEAQELLVHLHQAGLSRYDMPEYYIAMTAYPLTASGKILKRELVEWARSGRIRPLPVRWTPPEIDAPEVDAQEKG